MRQNTNYESTGRSTSDVINRARSNLGSMCAATTVTSPSEFDKISITDRLKNLNLYRPYATRVERLRVQQA